MEDTGTSRLFGREGKGGTFREGGRGQRGKCVDLTDFRGVFKKVIRELTVHYQVHLSLSHRQVVVS